MICLPLRDIKCCIFKISCCAPLRVFWSALRPLGSECGQCYHISNGLKEISCNLNHVLRVRRVQNRCYHGPFLCWNGFLFYGIAIKQPSFLQNHFHWLTTPRGLQHIPFILLDLSANLSSVWTPPSTDSLFCFLQPLTSALHGPPIAAQDTFAPPLVCSSPQSLCHISLRSTFCPLIISLSFWSSRNNFEVYFYYCFG